MKYILTLYITLLASLTAFAQNDPAAKKILDKVSANVRASKGITGNFSYTTKNRQGVKKGSVSGQIALQGNSYYLKQGSTEIFSNGTRVWNYNGSTEVTVNDVDNESKMLTPQKLLSNFYDQDFTYRLISSAGNFYTIQLVPVDKRKNFKMVTVYVDKTKNLITRADVVDKSDNTINFSLTNMNTNARLSAGRFVWDAKKYPNVEVIEQ